METSLKFIVGMIGISLMILFFLIGMQVNKCKIYDKNVNKYIIVYEDTLKIIDYDCSLDMYMLENGTYVDIDFVENCSIIVK